ncbi:uncharacterized protein KNAG_0D03720 [Huiozyma naganishii CBS 8797]|uniref:Uncharacterized protein n=1 Tax=Huiozyma naganishii (strain ATCC MYA-139 / BCRC 22969 / CBS 8797 / KCTC 17520 / NBRC 10181 / NCYC 3082 / Yp74L-3) TaxID=1071383 RepID=J7RKT9_HUIN7|nr:hypothetical protein KNAG_0D03720 [Kazachstania naganishii CBS 8797]CCK70118.1 hypothetical protein KNAG_0D03720 [Kazachstania naganishii CBS 8797]
MLPFNNYCIICDQLITPGKKSSINPSLDNEKLYCSPQCKEKDYSILSSENTMIQKVRNKTHQYDLENRAITITTSASEDTSTTLLEPIDPIITSPLLQPFPDNTEDGSNGDEYLFDYINLTKTDDHKHKYSIPKILLLDNAGGAATAENYYKSWLSNKSFTTYIS